jgi:4-carboxymuconolactone decarboxylase
VSQDLYEKGLGIRKEVLGAEYVERSLAGADDFNREFQDLLNEYCWGAVWGSDGLERRQRSLLNVAMLAALGRMHEFELHFKGALRNGVTREELKDTLIQVAVYCGMPAGVEAFRVARKVLAEIDAGSGDD